MFINIIKIRIAQTYFSCVRFQLVSNLKVKLFVKLLHFSNVWWVWFTVVLLQYKTKTLFHVPKCKTFCWKKKNNKVLTYNISVCSLLQRSNAFTTNQEHLKSSISVPICIIKRYNMLASSEHTNTAKQVRKKQTLPSVSGSAKQSR